VPLSRLPPDMMPEDIVAAVQEIDQLLL